MGIPQEGQKAPGFTVQNDEDEKVSLSDYAGQNVVLYFYPKDDTPG
jgi:peroxiredoxin Q/BCP